MPLLKKTRSRAVDADWDKMSTEEKVAHSAKEAAGRWEASLIPKLRKAVAESAREARIDKYDARVEQRNTEALQNVSNAIKAVRASKDFKTLERNLDYMRSLGRKHATDDLQPIGAEDPERAIALKKHEEGITKSQDIRKAKDMKARDIQASEIREKLGISESEWSSLSKDERQKKAVEAVRAKDDVLPVGDGESEARQELKTATAEYDKDKKNPKVFERYQKAVLNHAPYLDGKRMRDTELPIAIRSSRMVPMPSGENNEASYAPVRRTTARDRGRFVKAGDMQSPSDMSDSDLEKEIDQLASKTDKTKLENARLGFLTDEEVKRKKGKVTDYSAKAKDAEFKSGDKLRFYRGSTGTMVILTSKEADGTWTAKDLLGKRITGIREKELSKATGKVEYPENSKGAYVRNIGHTSKAKDADSIATLPIQTSGSEPADHMLRANQYEVLGDRARALDSYRAAASGYRRANDRANEAKARDGVVACQSRFAAQYDHPGKGRVKVCDSASVALRTAVERTRAGEAVLLVGKTVKPKGGD